MFVAIVVGEMLWGIGVGWVMLRLRRWVDEPRIEIMLSILTPFLAYWPPEYLGGSGVLATVTTGLYISWNGLRLISAATRLQGIFFWDFLIYVIEGMVFLITGLQARTLIGGDPRLLDQRSWRSRPRSSAPPSSWRASSGCFRRPTCRAGCPPRLRRRDPAPPWQWPFALAFTGVRGIVSLAAALAHSAGHRQRRAVSRPQPDPVPDLLRDPGDAGRPGPDCCRR